MGTLCNSISLTVGFSSSSSSSSSSTSSSYYYYFEMALSWTGI